VRFKPLLRGLIDSDRCHATWVLSNLGVHFLNLPLEERDGRLQLGPVQLDYVDFMPPIRRQTHTAFGILTYAGRMHVTLHYDSHVLNAAEASQLLETYVERVKATLRSSLEAENSPRAARS